MAKAIERTTTAITNGTVPTLGPTESALMLNDLASLTEGQRVDYYLARCRAAGLNPHAAPFRYLELDGRLVLYAGRECTDQLRAAHGVKLEVTSQEEVRGVLVVRVRATDRQGRCVEDIGAVPCVYPDQHKIWENGKPRWAPHPKAGQPLVGVDLANAMKKSLTQANRRATLSLCGLGDTAEPASDADAPAGRLVPVALPPSSEAVEFFRDDTEDWPNDRHDIAAMVLDVIVVHGATDYLKVTIGSASEPATVLYANGDTALGAFLACKDDRCNVLFTITPTPKQTYRILAAVRLAPKPPTPKG